MFSWRMLSILPLLPEYVNNLSTYFCYFLPVIFFFYRIIPLFFLVLRLQWDF